MTEKELKEKIKDWNKHLKIRPMGRISEDDWWGHELMDNHYLKGYFFPEYNYPLRQIYDEICEFFQIRKLPLKFTSRGYRYAGLMRKSRFSGPIEIVIHNSYGRDVGTLAHEVAHYWADGHGMEFTIRFMKVLRFLEDHLFPPPEGDFGWRQKLAKKYVALYQDNLDRLEAFSERYEIDPEELLDYIMEEL